MKTLQVGDVFPTCQGTQLRRFRTRSLFRLTSLLRIQHETIKEIYRTH